MHGRIEVKSIQGKGSTFTLYLGFERLEGYTAKKQGDASPVIQLKGKQILLCEDNEINVEIVQRLLEYEGVIVTVTRNGQECLDAFDEVVPGHYDAILMDVRMPVMDGLTATKILRQRNREDAEIIPIIALSGNAYQEDIERALAAGVNDYITKPVVPDILFRTLAAWIK